MLAQTQLGAPLYLLSWWNGRHAVLRRRCPEAGVRVQISAGAPPIITSVWCSGSAPLALTQETLVRIQQPKPPWTGSSVWSEHSTDNREVAGSIPARSTIINEQNDVLAEWLMQRPAKPRSTVRFRDTSPLPPYAGIVQWSGRHLAKVVTRVRISLSAPSTRSSKPR